MKAEAIKNLEPKDKIILMNEIWESLDAHKSHIKSPNWHEEILHSRVKKMKNGEAKYISLKELKNR